MFLGESLEDYLEAIVILSKEGKVRSIDIAKMLDVSKPSVNKAMNVLKEKGFITQESYGDIKLTKAGKEMADQVFDRHQKIRSFLISLGISVATAEKDACKIEHIISEETFEKFANFKK